VSLEIASTDQQHQPQIQFEAGPSIAAASALQIVIVGGLIFVIQRLFRLKLVL